MLPENDDAVRHRVALLPASFVGEPAAREMSFEPVDLQTLRKSGSTICSSPAGTTSTVATAMNLVTCMVGAGVLSLPRLFAKVGWYVAPGILVLTAWMTKELGVLIAETLSMIEDITRDGSVQYSFGRRPQKYEDMFEVAFGKIGKSASSVLTNVYQLMICSAYVILVGASLQYITNEQIPYRAGVLLVSVLLVPMVLARRAEFIAKLSVIGVICVAFFGLTIVYGSLTAFLWQEGVIEYSMLPEEPSEIGVVLALMLFGYFFQTVTATVRSEMTKPEEMPQAISWAIFTVLAVYMVAGCMGYFCWGARVQSNVLQSMVDPRKPQNRYAAGMILSVSILVKCFVSFPIMLRVVVISAEASYGGAYSMPLRIGVLSVAISLGLFLPYFLEVLGVVSSLIGAPAGVILPVCCYWKIRKMHAAAFPSTAAPSLVKHGVLLLGGFLALFFGTAKATNDLFLALSSKPGGNPFTHFFDPLK